MWIHVVAGNSMITNGQNNCELIIFGTHIFLLILWVGLLTNANKFPNTLLPYFQRPLACLSLSWEIRPWNFTPFLFLNKIQGSAIRYYWKELENTNPSVQNTPKMDLHGFRNKSLYDDLSQTLGIYIYKSLIMYYMYWVKPRKNIMPTKNMDSTVKLKWLLEPL